MVDISYTQNQVMFKLLNLFITDAVITSSKIAYHKPFSARRRFR